MTYPKADLPLEPDELAGLLLKLAEKKFKPGRISIKQSGGELVVEGDAEAVAWANGVIKKLNEK